MSSSDVPQLDAPAVVAASDTPVDVADADDGVPTTLLDLSTDSIAIILSHLGRRPLLADVVRVAAVCTELRAMLAEEIIWQTLCKSAWSIADIDLSSDWPRLSSFRLLYAVLETWAPRQGFHHLIDAYPWGALLLLRFRGGRFVGELLHHATPAGGFKCAAQEPVTILEVDFAAPPPAPEGGPAAAAALGTEDALPAWLRAARNPTMRWCGDRVVACTTCAEAPRVLCNDVIPAARLFQEASGVGFQSTDAAADRSLVPSRVQCRQYLQVQLGSEPPRAAADGRSSAAPSHPAAAGSRSSGDHDEREDDDEAASEAASEDASEESSDSAEPLARADDAMELRALWAPTRATPRGVTTEGEMWRQRLRRLPDHCARRRVTLGLVDGPTPASLASPCGGQAPTCVRSGMYIGDYSHNSQYGLYGNEALLLQRRTFDLGPLVGRSDLSADDGDFAALRALFGRGQANEPLSTPVLDLLQWLRLGSASHCTMLIGRKVTGDMHVPMGAATFVALLEPPPPAVLGVRLNAPPTPPVPTVAMTRGGEERVVRGWLGFGTLAFPGFGNPQWDPGWLVQLEDDADGRRFAFVWGSRQGDSANMLTQVVAQSTAVFVGEDDRMRPYWPPATPQTPE